MDILKSVSHRMNLLEETHTNLKDNIIGVNDDANNLDKKITSELSLLKKETAQILIECETIRRTVFHLGSVLREKVSKQEIQDFEQLIQDWPIQEYITQKELAPTFQRYAKH